MKSQGDGIGFRIRAQGCHWVFSNKDVTLPKSVDNILFVVDLYDVVSRDQQSTLRRHVESQTSKGSIPPKPNNGGIPSAQARNQPSASPSVLPTDQQPVEAQTPQKIDLIFINNRRP